MKPLTAKELDSLKTADVTDEQCERAHDEIVRMRAAINRWRSATERWNVVRFDAPDTQGAARIRQAAAELADAETALRAFAGNP